MSCNYETLLKPIEAALERTQRLQAMLGFDGTVDVICKPVQSREGTGSQFSPFKKMRDFGERIIAADEKSALIEIVIEQEKIGGNGPIMAKALSSSGVQVDYIGTVGYPDLHPSYIPLASEIAFHSIANPAVTHALEFDNGKVMLPALTNYEQVNAETLDKILNRSLIKKMVRKSHLCALLNWTCLPGWESILSWFVEEILPPLGRNQERLFFFDLADPSMHSLDELKNVLQLIRSFETFGQVVLGMNLNEVQQISRALQIQPPESEPDSLKASLEAIRAELEITIAMGHPVHFAACASANGSWSIAGPHTAIPKITTGAGDHLNAGFCLGLALGFPPEEALKLGVLYSGYYVRTAEPPRLKNIPNFIENLNKNAHDTHPTVS
ncbi:MAG: carbohydrate kinase family protein [Verrucomicrobiota bacterium]